MSARIAGFILRIPTQATTYFYSLLGITLSPHQHGGPVHTEMGPLSEEFVIEMYRMSDKFPRDALMIEVTSLDKALMTVDSFYIGLGKDPFRQPRIQMDSAEGMIFQYVSDPDGRDIMLFEKVT